MDERLSIKAGPAGERVLAVFAPDATAVMHWFDDTTLDITAWVADCILLGWQAADEDAASGTAPVPEQVQVGVVRLAAVEVFLVDADGQPWTLDPTQACEWASAGLVQMITAGVAYEATQGPTDTVDLT